MRVVSMLLVIVFGTESLGHHRRPVPAPADLEKAFALVKKLFSDEFAKKKSADQEAFARRLSKQVKASNGDPTGQYVFLRDCRELAAMTGDVDIAIDANNFMTNQSASAA